MSNDQAINEIIDKYTACVRKVDSDAKSVSANDGGSYGGHIRKVKGNLQEHITECLVKIAWLGLDQPLERLTLDKRKVDIPIKNEYVNGIKSQQVKQHIKSKIENYVYKLSVDKHVYVDGNFVMAIECKSYTENAMIKRILVDFDLLLSQYPNISCYLFQLENQLGGDYSNLNKISYGSYPTHTIQSYFNVSLNIITLLEGERNINKPIHKNEHFKPLYRKPLKDAVEILREDLKKHA